MRNPPGGCISERPEPHGDHRLRDCSYSSGMVGYQDAGGHFPNPDLVAEREALERADDWPDETGAPLSALDVAMSRRYHWQLHHVPDLVTALMTPGITLVLQGTNADWPARLRHGFLGNHCAAVRVFTDHLMMLDPLMDTGYPGDRVSRAEVLAWAWGPTFARFATWYECAPKPPPAILVHYRYGGQPRGRGRYLVTSARANVRSRPTTGAPIVRMLHHGAAFICRQSTLHGQSVGGSRIWRGNADGTMWVHDSLVAPGGHS